jgi:hypothetical protein
VIYVGTNTVHISTNGGTTWTQIATGLPTRNPTYLAVHPTDPNTAFAVFSGFGVFTPTNTGHVFKTTNGGARAFPGDDESIVIELGIPG